MKQALLASLAVVIVGTKSLEAQAPRAEGPESPLVDLMELLDTPVVSASKSTEKLSEAPATMIVVSRRDLERRGYTQFRELLEDLPGFDLALTYGDTFLKSYVRGYRNTIGDSMLILLDGQVLNHLWFGTSDSVLMAMPLSHVERVEIVYGPASALYGANAFMGVINVITGRGLAGTDSLNANLSGGSFSQKGVDLSWRQNFGSWGYSLAARRFEGDLDDRVLARYEYTHPKYLTGIGGRSIFGGLAEHYGTAASSPWETTALDLRLWNGNLEFGMQYLTLRSGYGLHYTWDNYLPGSASWERPEWSFYAKYSHEFSREFSTTATVRYRLSGVANDSLDWWTGWDSQAQSFITYPEWWAVTTSALSYNQDFQWLPDPRLTFNFGFVFSQEAQQKGYLHGPDDGIGIDTATVKVGDAGPKPNPSLADSMHTSILRRGAYLQGKIRLDEHQSLVLGLRNDWHVAFKEAVTLRGGYVGNWGGFNLKALYGQAYQEPTPRQLFGGWSGSGSDPSLRPQRSWTAEFGLGYTTAHWGLASNLYRVKNSNMILTVPGGAQNVGRMEITGMDLQGQLQFPGVFGRELRVWGYFSHFLKATGEPYNLNLNTLGSSDISDIARTKLHLGATAAFSENLSLTLKGRHIGPRNVVATNPAGRVAGYTTLEAYLQYGRVLVDGLSLGLKVTNLLDASYFQPGLRNADAGFTPAYFDQAGDYHGSSGYYSSLLPQAGRGFEVVLRYRY